MNSQERRFPRIFKRNPAFALSLFMLVSMALISYGCGDSSTGPSGGNNNGGNNNGGNEIGMEPTFANVGQIFSQNCGSCHIGGPTSGVQLDSYDNAINSVGDQYGIEVIQPGDAAASPLVDKIQSTSPQHGDRMPQGRSPLPSDRIDQIKEWINQGAENN